jgi:anti-anti-sigma factor
MHTNKREANVDTRPDLDGNVYVPGCHVIVHVGGGTVVVEIIGEHDLASHDPIRDLFLSLLESNSLLVVDVSKATFVDSSFLRALVIAHKHAEQVGSRLRLQLGTAPGVRRVLEISELTDYLDCVHDRDEALR